AAASALSQAGPRRPQGGAGTRAQPQRDRQVVAGQRAGRGPDQAEFAAVPDVAAHLPQCERRRTGQFTEHPAGLDDRGRPGDHAAAIALAAGSATSEVNNVGRSPRTAAASRAITPRSAPTNAARSVLLMTSRSERVTPGPPLRGTLSPPATSITKI